MSALHSGAATLPRGFRFHQPGDSNPRTPEPFAVAGDETEPPSAPRPRFRIKRRYASQLTAPTQQFLASVAAADVPIPSIEVVEAEGAVKEPMRNAEYPPMRQLHTGEDTLAHEKVRKAPFSLPKTPVPEVAHCHFSSHYPDWTIDSTFSSDESSPECESSRPSTSRSTHTSASLFSRISFTSEDAQCMSPEFEVRDAWSRKHHDAEAATIDAAANDLSKRKMRRAPWTRAMSEHLWSTYSMYCQDPKVTPFRTGRNGIPPHGVCARVAREAKRSWKGSKTHLAVDGKGGSLTPTAESSGAYIQWPHTCAATRARLRELCRLKGVSSATRAHQHLSHSPTRFGTSAMRHWNRRTTPLRSRSIFSSRDMNMSLSMCTADSLQPTGPMAQLTSSALESAAAATPPHKPSAINTTELGFDFREHGRSRLGSPFTAQSYGPSSSSSLGDDFSSRSSLPPQQACSSEPRRSLQSPVCLTRSRSHTLQKRRSRQAANEIRRNKRPSLGSDLWAAPQLAGAGAGGVATTRPSLELSSTSSRHYDDLFFPRTCVGELFAATKPLQHKQQQQPPQGGSLSLGASTDQPPRLGSPFATPNSSLSFPNRLSQPRDLFDAIRRPFATVQQPIEDSSGPTRANLASRLTYINERLREFRRRDEKRRRSESPF